MNKFALNELGQKKCRDLTIVQLLCGIFKFKTSQWNYVGYYWQIYRYINCIHNQNYFHVFAMKYVFTNNVITDPAQNILNQR